MCLRKTSCSSVSGSAVVIGSEILTSVERCGKQCGGLLGQEEDSHAKAQRRKALPRFQGFLCAFAPLRENVFSAKLRNLIPKQGRLNAPVQSIQCGYWL